jgi:hypothetical protein
MVRLLPAQGFVSTKISRVYKPGADISMSRLGSDSAIEVKRRATGFASFMTDSTGDRIVKADQQEPLVVLRMSLAAEIAKAATGSCTEGDNGRAA